MRNLLLAVATGVLLIGTVPASAQIYGGVTLMVQAFRLARSDSAWGPGTITVCVVANTMPMAPTVRW